MEKRHPAGLSGRGAGRREKRSRTQCGPGASQLSSDITSNPQTTELLTPLLVELRLLPLHCCGREHAPLCASF